MATIFTPWASLAGGALIGLSAVLLMAVSGRIAGISGIVARLLPPFERPGLAARLAFVLGLVVAPFALGLATGTVPAPQIAAGPALLVVAGLLVGFGAVWGHGCTSGHGVCGLARLSPRSLVAVLVFMATAIATVFLMRHA
ncbi:YeeE/YedE family protein [Falsiroseomonas tokyonensis]|uniref:YeeE/YedE family protein n=1 Tax=Falsiroseomonas tokyonensis TaxID=430521 RepID=A0ABV7C159_9PROT|nr:YeeE/YedE thiosulfate transporter family protein [Falsiroseomonas tokyonensis]MBU8540683.1 YeeE/YedE family protein [Falsiroseomonas tokyonensis]